MHVCRYFHDDPLPDALREELEDELYRRLIGHNRNDAAADQDAEVASPVRLTLRRLLATADFERYTAGNARMSERIAHEAVHWTGHRWAAMEAHQDLDAEEAELDRIANEAPAEPSVANGAVRRVAKRAAAARPELAGAARAAMTDIPGDPRRARLECNARIGYLVRAWRQRVAADRSWRDARALGRAVGSFIREIQDALPGLARAQELVRDALGNDDALWDLSIHEWETLDTRGLDAAATTLGQNPEIERLAQILGRSRAVTNERRVQRVERTVRAHSVGIGKSEVTGVRFGDDLTSLIASETALLSTPETEELFYAKLARRELLILDYRSIDLVEDVRTRRVWTTERVLAERGPIVVCVDTSGSMLGLPEQVAKAIVLALARRVATDRRRVEIIAFASDVRCFTLDHANARLTDLAAFLQGSFHGGTDLNRALLTALTTLEQSESEHADVLVVSDFRVPKIADRHVDRIDRQRGRGTLFHTLTVGRAAVHDPLNVFDSSWFFNTTTGRIDPELLTAIR